MKKRSVVLLFLLIGFAIITTTYAFTVTPIQDAVSFVDSTRSNSDRGITSYEAYPLGTNLVYVKFTLGADPPGDGQHNNVEVRVMPLTGSNDVITAGVGGAMIQLKIDAESWDLSAQSISEDEDIIMVFTRLTNTDAIDIYITFEVDVKSTFVTCMIEIREYN